MQQHKQQHIFFNLLLLAASIITAALSYLQVPGVMLNADSSTYLSVLSKIAVHHLSPSSLVDAVRLPGYPLFLYAIAGSNLLAATFLQMALFVLIAPLTYWIAFLAFNKPWIALCLGLLVATNPTLLGYFRQVMSEALACFLLTALVLLSVLYILSPRGWLLIGIGGLLGLLIFTRPEWVVLPLLLFPLLLLATPHQRKGLLRHIGIVLALAVCIYACVGIYIQENGRQNGYHGFSAIQNMNFLGKVLQYHMEDEAPASQQQHTARLTSCIAQLGDNRDPWQLLPCDRELASPWAIPAGNYAWSVIASHPLEFIGKTVPIFFTSQVAYFDPSPAQQNKASPVLQALTAIHHALYECNILFPALVFWPLWLLWLALKKKPIAPLIWSMTILWGIACYGSVLVALAGYMDQDYARFHAVFSPLTTIVIWGSLLFGASLLVKRYKP